MAQHSTLSTSLLSEVHQKYPSSLTSQYCPGQALLGNCSPEAVVEVIPGTFKGKNETLVIFRTLGKVGIKVVSFPPAYKKTKQSGPYQGEILSQESVILKILPLSLKLLNFFMQPDLSKLSDHLHGVKIYAFAPKFRCKSHA